MKHEKVRMGFRIAALAVLILIAYLVATNPVLLLMAFFPAFVVVCALFEINPWARR